ncbi:hypothetical protein C8J56DRAFT_1167028 [Mycena floridula]|nr:hypothetical protein C8J56DRAFT_1167028 [Mycena floridula]
MPEKCRLCGLAEASEPNFPSEATYTSPAHLLPFIVSNDAPSHDQESQFRELLTAGVQELRDLDVRIATMRHDLEILVRHRASKGREVEEYKSVLHPIRRLPEEILCEIFLSFVNEDLEWAWQKGASSLDALSTIWILPRVSSHWRSVALSFARMWSTMQLTTEDFVMSRLLEKLRVLGTQIHRSANHQLSISITNYVNIPKSHPLLPMLFTTSSRWKELYLDITLTSLDSFSPLEGSLSSMKKLHVRVVEERIPTLTTLSMFEFAPKLTTLVGKPYILSQLKLPFSQIIEYGQYDIYTCISHAGFLSRMPNLQRITTNCVINNEFDLQTGVHADRIPRQITLPLVTSIDLFRELGGADDIEHSTSDCDLVLRLTLPALRELEIDVYRSIDGLQALLRRSQCPLDALSLYIYDVSDDACIRLLKDIPTLTAFTLKCTETLTVKFMEAFAKSPTVVPSLRFLTLQQSCGLDSMQIEELKASRPLLSVVAIDGVIYYL